MPNAAHRTATGVHAAGAGDHHVQDAAVVQGKARQDSARVTQILQTERTLVTSF